MTLKTLTIRPYEGADNATLTEIWYAASRRAHPFLGEDRLLAHRRLVEEHYLPEAETWVSCLAGTPVGFLGLLEDHVGALFITPDQQGRGIGRALIAHGLALRGRLTLNVYAANGRSVEFYRGCGFVEVERHPTDQEGLPFEEIGMLLSTASG